MTRLILFIASLLSIQCQSQNSQPQDKKAQQEAIIKEHVYDCADKINYTVMMAAYQDCSVSMVTKSPLKLPKHQLRLHSLPSHQKQFLHQSTMYSR